MFNLFKRKSSGGPVPAWASFFTADEYAAFIKAVEDYFRRKNLTVTIDDGSVKVPKDKTGYDTFGLHNLAQVCKNNAVRDYPAMVAGHFGSLERSHNFMEEFDKINGDFEKVKQYLGVRLYPTSYVAHIGLENVAGKQFAEGVYQVLVFDLPDSVMNVSTSLVEKWGKSYPDLFAVGRANIKNNYEFTESRQDAGGFTATVVVGDHFFTPNILLELSSRKDLLGKHGALVGMPNRHAAIIYPIQDMGMLTAINGLIPVIHGMHQKGPGSLSEKLFLYQDGEFTDLPYKIEDNTMKFFPPEKLVNLMNSMAGA